MSDLKHSDEELKKIFLKETGTKKHSEYFIKKYYEIYKDVEDDDGFLEEGEILKDAVLAHTIEFYLNKFELLIQAGHNPEWANQVADHSESDEVAVGEAYLNLKKQDLEKARKQLEIYCRSLGKSDPLFLEYYTYLLDEHEPHDAVEYSENYVRAYRKKIVEGKSEIFAKVYAEFMSYNDRSKNWCHVQAEAYERAINEGKSDNYAFVYSEKYVQMIFNNYGSPPAIEKDEYYEYLHQKVLDEVGDLN